MYSVLLLTINQWNAAKNERQKLQHAYLFLAGVIILCAGITSLFNAELGHTIVKFALVALGTFIINALCWNLLQSILLDRLEKKPKRK